METTPIYGWRTPSVNETADGPLAFATLAGDIEQTVASTATSTYTPNWTADIANPANPATRIGRYSVRNGFCELLIWLSFSGSTSGGRGNLRLSLPVPALSSIPEQRLNVKFWVPTLGTIPGIGLIFGSDNQRIAPYFPNHVNTGIHNHWRNVDGSGNGNDPKTGIPYIADTVWGIQSGGNFLINGKYAVQT